MDLATATSVTLASEPAGSSSWWWQALSGSFMIWCLVVLALGGLATMICLRMLWRTGRADAQRRQGTLIGDQAGVATIEFCLVLPILLFMVLLLGQTTLAMGGNMYMHYSAYIATRAAVVYIPQDDGTFDGGPNRISNTVTSAKREAIRMAAVFALEPVSGRLEDGALQASLYKDGITGLYQGYNKTPPNWLKVYAPITAKMQTMGISSTEARLNYAEANTDIFVMETIVHPDESVEFRRIGGSYEFGAKDPVTIQVEHRLYLAVPYVRFLFSDTPIQQGEYDTHYGAKAKSYGYNHNADERRYRTMTAQYTLTNNGIIDELPPRPTIPRLDPSQRQMNPLGLPQSGFRP